VHKKSRRVGRLHLEEDDISTALALDEPVVSPHLHVPGLDHAPRWSLAHGRLAESTVRYPADAATVPITLRSAYQHGLAKDHPDDIVAARGSREAAIESVERPVPSWEAAVEGVRHPLVDRGAVVGREIVPDPVEVGVVRDKSYL
jgi:hypothetical protein